MKLWPFGSKDDGGKLEFHRNICQSETSGDAMKPTSPEQDYVAMIGKMGFMVMDERLIDFLCSNPVLHPLIAVFSPVNATIKLSKHEAVLKRIRIENLITMIKLTMASSTYDSNGLEILEGLRLYGHDRVSEAEEGWKGHLVTEQVKVIETRSVEKKGRFG